MEDINNTCFFLYKKHRILASTGVSYFLGQFQYWCFLICFLIFNFFRKYLYVTYYHNMYLRNYSYFSNVNMLLHYIFHYQSNYVINMGNTIIQTRLNCIYRSSNAILYTQMKWLLLIGSPAQYWCFLIFQKISVLFLIKLFLIFFKRVIFVTVPTNILNIIQNKL